VNAFDHLAQVTAAILAADRYGVIEAFRTLDPKAVFLQVSSLCPLLSRL
jgi:hypothetical protein